jgi:hypothetical protein
MQQNFYILIYYIFSFCIVSFWVMIKKYTIYDINVNFPP